MRRAALYSLLLHLIFLLLVIFGLPWSFRATSPLLQPIPVEVLTIAEETMSPKPSLTPLKEKEKPDEKKPETKPAPEKPTPSPVREPEPEPEVKPEPKPDVKEEPKTEPKPLPDPKPESKPEPKPEIKEPTPQPKPKPSPPKPKLHEKKPDKKPEKKKKEETFDSLLKNLEDLKEEIEDDTADSKDPDAKPNAQQAGKVGDKLTVSEMDPLKSYFKKCWSLPAGAQDAENLLVQIKIGSNPEGIIKTAKIVDMRRYNSDAYFRAAADSAKRAVEDPRCKKMPLPLDKYETWKEIILNFNPKDMLGG